MCEALRSLSYEVANMNVDVNIDHIQIGGDQLTAARIRGSQKMLSNSESGKEHLEGLIPVIEDWHTNTFMLLIFCMVVTLGQLLSLEIVNVCDRNYKRRENLY